MKEVTLPSKAVLKITLAPFAVAKTLFQAVLKELRNIPLSSDMDMTQVYKDLFCTGYSSKEIEAALWECFKRCTINSGAGDFKIDDQTFEPEDMRQDFIPASMEVAQENIAPFAKSLYAEFQRGYGMTGKSRA